MGDVRATVDIRISRAIVGALRTHDLAGFELWQWLGPIQGADTVLDEASLYPTLYRLEAQGLLSSAWHEEGGTRRVYRITAAGQKEAEEHGWGAVAARGRRTGDRERPGETGEPEWTWRSEAERQPSHSQDEPEYRAVEAYVAELDCALALDALHRHDVDAEIGDHLSASIARREAQGQGCIEATEQAIAALGPAPELARAINSAQLSRARLEAGLRWGSAVATLTAFTALAVGLCIAFFVTPVAADVVTAVAGTFGIHLFAPSTPEWRTEEVGVCGWIGAFVAARRSMPNVSLRSRRAEEVAWPIWAAAGATALAAVVLLFPFRLDGFAILTLAGIPLAWVLGTRHPATPYGDTVTARGLALALIVATVALLAPGARVWVYDRSNAPAHGSPFEAGAPVTAVWEGSPETLVGQMTISLEPASGWTDPRLEVWPAAESGLSIVPDSTAAEPALVAPGGEPIDLSLLSHDVPTWWLAVTAVGPDGRRHTLDSSVHIGWRNHGLNNILAGLLGWT
jgi:DNA-binding PadR family transcriptional regulator